MSKTSQRRKQIHAKGQKAYLQGYHDAIDEKGSGSFYGPLTFFENKYNLGFKHGLAVLKELEEETENNNG